MRKPREAGIQLSRAGAKRAVGPGKVTWQGKADAVLKPRHGGLSGKATSGFSLGSENPSTLRNPSQENPSFTFTSKYSENTAPGKFPKQVRNFCYNPHTSQG